MDLSKIIFYLPQDSCTNILFQGVLGRTLKSDPWPLRGYRGRRNLRIRAIEGAPIWVQLEGPIKNPLNFELYLRHML